MANTATQSQGVGVDLLQQFLTNPSNQPDLPGLLDQVQGAKKENLQRMMFHFGTQGKPMRHTGINGSAIDPMTGRQVTSGMDQFYEMNPHLRRGESSAVSEQRRQEGFAHEQEMTGLLRERELTQAQGGNDILNTFLQEQGLTPRGFQVSPEPAVNNQPFQSAGNQPAQPSRASAFGQASSPQQSAPSPVSAPAPVGRVGAAPAIAPSIQQAFSGVAQPSRAAQLGRVAPDSFDAMLTRSQEGPLSPLSSFSFGPQEDFIPPQPLANDTLPGNFHVPSAQQTARQPAFPTEFDRARTAAREAQQNARPRQPAFPTQQERAATAAREELEASTPRQPAFPTRAQRAATSLRETDVRAKAQAAQIFELLLQDSVQGGQGPPKQQQPQAQGNGLMDLLSLFLSK